MANEYLLSEYADEAALQKQTAFILQSFEQIDAKAKSVGASLKDVFSSLGNSSTGTKQLIDDFKKMESAASDFTKVTKQSTEQLKQQNAAIIASSQATKEETASLEKNIETRRRLQNSMASYLSSQKDDLALMKAGTITREEYNKRVTESQIKVEQYKNRIIDLDKVIKIQTASTQALTKEQKLAQAVNDAERNSLGRAQALILLYTNEKKKLNLATADGARLNDSYNKAIAASNAFILKNADAVTAQAKNVGNYAESVGKLLNGALQPLRTLANIIPGLGLGGIFLLAFDAISNAAQALGLFNNKLFTTREQSSLLGEINSKAAESAGKEAGQLKVLRAEIESTNVPMATRLQAIKDIKEQYPEYFKGLTNEELLTGKVGNAYNLAANAIIRKARANAAAAEIERLSSENINKGLDVQLKAQEAKDKIKKAQDDAAISSGGSAPGVGGNLGGASKQAKQKAIAENFALESKAATDLVELNNKKIDFLLQYTVAGAKETVKVEEDKTKKVKDNALQALKEIQDTTFEIYNISQRAKLRKYDEDIKSDSVYYLDKLIALKEYVKASQELIDRQEQEDIANKQRSAAREIQRLNEEKKGKSPEQIARINENIKIVEENLQQDILLIQAKYADESVKLSQNAAVIKTKIVEDQLKKEKELYDEYAKFEQDTIDQTNARFKKGLDKRFKDEQDAAKKLLELNKELNNKKVEAAMAAENFLFTLANASVTRQLNAIQALKDAAEAKASRDIEIVAATAEAGNITQEEAAARTIVINARLQAQKDQLDKKSRDAELQRAKFQRAQQIFEITIGAIKAVAAIKAQASILLSNPLTAAYAAVALSQIPFVIGGAALSVAGILASPLPKYKTGKAKGQGKTGWSIVDDGGVPEPIKRADGSVEVGGNQPRVTWLDKEDTVFKNEDAFLKDLQMSAMRDTARQSNGKVNETNYMAAMTNNLGQRLDKQTSYLKKIAGKQEQIIVVFNNDQYIRDNTNWN